MPNLAFIDIGPGGIQFFHEIANRLVGWDSFFYAERVKVRSKLARLGRTCYPAGGAGPVGEPLSRETMKQVVNRKNIAGLGSAAQVDARVNRTYWRLAEFFDSCSIDAVFLWNGSGLIAQVAVFIARQRGLKTVFGEAGYFHNTMQLDPSGVNYAASFTPTIADDFLQTETETGRLEDLRTLIEQGRGGRLPPYQRHPARVRASLLSKVLTEWRKLRGGRGLSQRPGLRQITDEPERLPERFVFVPLQVVTDSQLLVYSPMLGNDMEGFIRLCHSALRSVSPEHRLVVKLHPAEDNSVDYRPLMAELPDIVWLARYPIKQVIAAADLVITINSTVGVEALMEKKPVITLGQSFYNVDGVVQHVTSQSDLVPALARALARPADVERIERFVYHLYYNCFTHGNKRNYSEQSYAAVLARLRQLID